MVGAPQHRLYVYDKVLGQIVKTTSWEANGHGDGAPRYINFSVSDGELVVLLKTGEQNAKILRTGLPLSDKMSEDIIVTEPPFYTENATFTVKIEDTININYVGYKTMFIPDDYKPLSTQEVQNIVNQRNYPLTAVSGSVLTLQGIGRQTYQSALSLEDDVTTKVNPLTFTPYNDITIYFWDDEGVVS